MIIDHLSHNLNDLPKRDWGKNLESSQAYRGYELKIFSVIPQAYLIATTQPVGLLAGYIPEAVLVKSFEKNYKTASKPGVVAGYGFERAHAEPIEQLDYVYECIYDRACEAEMNRYRHNSKNYESGRYIDYIKHGITVVLPEDIDTPKSKEKFIKKVMQDFQEYVDVIEDSSLPTRKRRQQARRRLGTYLAVESTYKCNLRSLWHMGAQRSEKFSCRGAEAETQISSIVTQMIEEALPYLPTYKDDLLQQIAKGIG